MPALGADMEAGTVVEWRVAPGSRVHRGDVVAVVETDKGAIDVEIFEDGVIVELLAQPGEKLPVGAALALVEIGPSPPPSPAKAGEGVRPSPQPSPTGVGEGAEPSPPLPLAGEVGRRPGEGPEALTRRVAAVATTLVPSPAKAGEGTRPSPQPSPTGVGEGVSQAPSPAKAGEGGGEGSVRLRISPAARARAHELGVELTTLTGSGPHGAITLDDVQRAAAATQPAASRPEPQTAPRAAPPTSMRDAIAASMSRSKREIPHYYLSLTADVTPSVDWLATHNAAVPVTERLLFAALLVKAVALACRAQPGFSGFHRNGRFEEAPVTHVGVAVAIRGGGLVAPAITDTVAKPLPQLMAEFRDIVARARAGRLKASELSAPTIILTSLGDSPLDAVFPIIQPPQVAIVGAGAVLARPWIVDGAIAIRQLCTLSLAADHRVTDGRLGAQFLGHIARLLATPDATEWSAP